MPHLRRYSPTKLSDGAKMAIFLRPVFSANLKQHISDMHSKFALRPHHVWKYGIYLFSSLAARVFNKLTRYSLLETSNPRRLRLGKEKKEDRNHRAKI